ncbi:MAG: hypothetical protein ISS78_09075 [Phycisphaerae bacterium]|nr:hypothetical protein [Phycisphaerae bacterium]
MRLIVTAGPTREYIDTVRFITNASGGRMGCAVARAAAEAGHHVTVLLAQGLVSSATSALTQNTTVVPFVTVEDLKGELRARFAECDALVMAAAVGDFRLEEPAKSKLSRSAGPINLRLLPTEDVVAAVCAAKRDDQVTITFAVEDGAVDEMDAKARAEMAAKKADYVVVNTPVAIGRDDSRACVLSASGVVLPWAMRSKQQLAREIVNLLTGSE